MSKSKKIVTPEGLRPGDKIGVTAPAGMVNIEAFHQGIDMLRTLGFRVVIPEDLFSPSSFLAGTDGHRAHIFNQIFEMKEIKAVFCARGGFGAMRILPLIDFRLIRKNPKIVIGFSDITALLVNIYLKCNLWTYHGPVVTTLTDATEASISALKKALAQGPTYQICMDNLRSLLQGRAEGPLIGGNLATLCHLIGTPYAPSYNGHILFIEDIGEPLYKIDRMLSQMELAGCFKGVRGLALGAFEGCGDPEPIFDLIHEKFEKYEIPVVTGIPIGHIHENITIPIGAYSILNADDGSMTILPLTP